MPGASTLLTILTLVTAVVCGGNTTCTSSELNWYTQAVGETPCTTYQRLRQICNVDYVVGNFREQTPGDNCDDQVDDCCCNSISWALSMLCMNCQQGDVDSQNGTDAGNGSYYTYRNEDQGHCVGGTNQSLPTEVQSGVCNRGIKIMSSLYSLFWDAGDWYYVYTRDTCSEDFSANSNMVFGRCPQDFASSVSLTAHSSSQPASSTSSVAPSSTISTATSYSRLQSDAIAGIAVGSTACLLILVGVYYIYRRSKHSPVTPGPAPGITPFMYEETSSFGPESIQASAGRIPISGSVGESNGRRISADSPNLGSSSTYSGQVRHTTSESRAGTSSIVILEGHTVEENAGLLTSIGFSEHSHGRPLSSQPETRPPPSYRTTPSRYSS